MNARNGRALMLLVLVATPVLLYGCLTRAGDDLAVAPPAIDCATEGDSLQLGCPYLPNTDLSAQPDYDYFAWNAFVAMNWPAVVPSGDNGYTRGIADTTQHFLTAAPSAQTVWETFKEKREIFFPTFASTSPTTNWNADYDYGPLVTQALANACTPADSVALVDVDRAFAQGSKIFFDILDETVEVAAEALEDTSQTCAGYPNPMCGTPQANACCSVPGQAVGPRVWLGPPADGNPVIYEVKANYDYFTFVTSNGYNVQATAEAAAATGIRLPTRTSAGAVPGENPGVADYTSAGCRGAQPGLGHPCPAGAVQVKSAWIGITQDQLDDYHWTVGATFRNAPEVPGGICSAADTLGLVGLHIIQRIHTGAPGDSTAQPQGGTYIFATWEHTGIQDGQFSYVNYLTSDTTHTPYPALTDALPLDRRFGILPGTQVVNSRVHTQMGCGGSNAPIWCNYQLIGTQFMAIDLNDYTGASDPNDPTGIGQPLYLANLLVESNDGLQLFQGLPPNVEPINKYASASDSTTNTTATFMRAMHNLPFNQGNANGGGFFNMGGCMGCHGVAQLKGYGFSFILLENQAGVDAIDTQHSFEVPPNTGSQ